MDEPKFRITDTRQLCRAVGAAVHTPDVERYAARLVRRGLLPSAGCKVGAIDAALLLLAVAAAPRPADAPHVVVTAAGLPLAWVDRRFGTAKSPTWVPGTDADIAAIPSDPLECLAAAIEEALDPEGQFVFGSLKVAEGGASAELHACLGADYREYRAGYALRSLGSQTGLSRFVELHRDVIEALAGALWPPTERVVSHDRIDLAIH